MNNEFLLSYANQFQFFFLLKKENKLENSPRARKSMIKQEQRQPRERASSLMASCKEILFHKLKCSLGRLCAGQSFSSFILLINLIPEKIFSYIICFSCLGETLISLLLRAGERSFQGIYAFIKQLLICLFLHLTIKKTSFESKKRKRALSKRGEKS